MALTGDYTQNPCKGVVPDKVGGLEYTAIEQNPDKPSRWSQLARSGHEVVQFKDVQDEPVRGGRSGL